MRTGTGFESYEQKPPENRGFLGLVIHSMTPPDVLPSELHSLVETIQLEAADRGFLLKADKLEYGYRLYFPTVGGRGSFSIYYSPKKRRYSIVAPELPDPDLVPLVELAAAKTGTRSPWPEQKAEQEVETWEEVFSDDPALSKHVSEKLHGLQAAGFFMTDFRKLSGGIQLDIAKDDVVYKINLYVGRDGRIKVVPSGKRSKELSAIVRLLTPEFDVKQSVPETERKLETWLGTDEAGKGDYFGPLVVGGFLSDWDVAKELESMGIRESKGLTKGRVLGLSRLLWGKFKKRCAVVELRPERYNQLYEDFRGEGGKLNRLLGWAHARVIQDFGDTSSVKTVVIDRFGNPENITRYLKKMSNVELLFRARAESNPAVAAASILAKARFLERLDKLSDEVDLELPPGAGAQVIKAAHKLVEKHGPDALSRVAKLHFKTTEKVMAGLEEESVGREGVRA